MIRDPQSKAILTTDTVALNKYRQEKYRAKQIELLSKEVSELRIAVAELYEMMEKREKIHVAGY